MSEESVRPPNVCFCGYVGTGVIFKHRNHGCASCGHGANQHVDGRACKKCGCRRFVKQGGGSVRTVGSGFETNRRKH
jgi:hypothetical protein